ncbi:MAG: hypothetical protein R6U62_04555, partial [Bacteroidales bacterium]
ELKGENTQLIYASQPEHAEMGQKLNQTGNTAGFVKLVHYRKKNKETFLGETSAFHLKDAEGAIKAYVGIIREKNSKNA